MRTTDDMKITDKEMEELGWEKLGSGWWNLKDVPGKLGYWLYVRYRYWGENSTIIAYRGNPKDFPNTESEHLFQGDVDTTKEDFHKLMIQTHLI